MHSQLTDEEKGVTNGMRGAVSEKSGAKPSILFISHYSGRNGAPLILLGLMKWLRQRADIDLHVLVRDTGEMVDEFRRVATVIQAPRLGKVDAALKRRVSGEASISEKEDKILREEVKRLNPDIIYSNTITNTREILALAPLGIPIICHVHELEYWIRYELGLEKAAATVPSIQRYIAAGVSVREFLINGVGVRREIIDVVNEFPSVQVDALEKESETIRNQTRSNLGIDQKTCLIGACGTVDWRKGADLFLAVAQAVTAAATNGDVRFVWIGGSPTAKSIQQLQFDVSKAGLSEKVHFVGPQSTPSKYYHALDIFLLPSREDPCPLVMLEAAAHGLPIVCFQNSGGAPEFVKDDAGIAVRYLDIQAMAQAIILLRDNPELRVKMGKSGSERAKREHDPSRQCAAIMQSIIRVAPALKSALIN
jgi:glycosyltransferase involved in cell wall biosynthesis